MFGAIEGDKADELDAAKLHAKIGELTRRAIFGPGARAHTRLRARAMIDKDHRLPVSRQARLLGLARSSVYYRPVATGERDLALMAAIDWRFIPSCPSTVPGRSKESSATGGLVVGRGHVATLMRRMGITAIAPKRRLSKPAPGHAPPMRSTGLHYARKQLHEERFIT